MSRGLGMNLIAPFWLLGLILAIIPWAVSMAQGVSSDINITSPQSGTAVTPGQTIAVDVVVAPGVSYSKVGLLVEDFGIGPVAIKGVPPYEFSIQIPNNLVGSKKITAFGVTSPGAGVFSASITVDIEPSSPIKSLSVSPQKIYFNYAGQRIPLSVTGNFVDGSSLDITRSSRIIYRSEDPTVATVDKAGLVTATDAGLTGSTAVIVTYGGHSVGVPVSVPAAIRGDLNGDGVVDRDDLNIILTWRNRRATSPNDARDLNHDGVINALDARILVTLCTRRGCATQGP